MQRQSPSFGNPKVMKAPTGELELPMVGNSNDVICQLKRPGAPPPPCVSGNRKIDDVPGGRGGFLWTSSRQEFAISRCYPEVDAIPYEAGEADDDLIW